MPVITPSGERITQAEAIRRGVSGRIVKEKKPLGVQRPTKGGGSVIVTAKGQVTIKDPQGKTKEKFRTSKKSAQKFVSKQGRAIEREVKELRSVREIETREEQLERLAKSKVLSEEGKKQVLEQLERIKKEKILTPGVVRLQDIQSKRFLDNLRTQTIKDVLKAIDTSDSPLAPTKDTFSNRLGKELLQTQLSLENKKAAALKKSSEANKIIERISKGGGSTKDLFEATKLKLLSSRDLAILGVGRAANFGTQLLTSPKKTAIEQIKAIKDPETYKQLVLELQRDPIGLVTEFFIFNKAAGVTTNVIKRSPLGFAIQKEIYLANLPKNIRPSVRKILNAGLTQKKIKPFDPKKISKVDFVKPKTLTATEWAATLKALRSAKVDSAIFGSSAANILSKRKTLKPKDIDIATSSTRLFNQEFIKNLPAKDRINYVLRGEKVFNKVTGKELFDIKPFTKLRPNADLFGKGFLPVSGLKTVIDISFKKKKGLIPSELPFVKKKLITGALEVATEKLVKAKGIKITGFGEQTLRKALGTLQVLIEKNVKRAKDPQSFLLSLKIQIDALKRIKSKTSIGKLRNKAKINTLQEAVKLLESKKFAELLEKQVPGITKDFPLVAKINPKKLKTLSKGVFERLELKEKTFKKLVKVSKKPKPKVKLEPKLKKVLKSELPKSQLPISKLPTSRVPVSKIPKSRVPISKIPKSAIAKALSKVPSSKFKTSKTPVSKLKISPIPTSKIPLSKISSLPTSRVPVSKIPKSDLGKTLSKIPASKLKSVLAKQKITKQKPKIESVKDSKKRKTGFQVEIRRKGKFELFASNTLSKTGADKLGKFVIDNSVAASYRLVKTKKKIDTKITNIKTTPTKIRTAKKDKKVKIEKRKFRIDTTGEKKGLKSAKLRKNLGLKAPRVTTKTLKLKTRKVTPKKLKLKQVSNKKFKK